MTKTLALLVAASAVLLIVGIPHMAEAEPFPVIDYEQAVAKYVNSLANLSLQITTRETILETGDPYFQKSTISTIKGYFRAVSEFSGKTGTVTRKRWELLRPDGWFYLKEPVAGKFALEIHDQNVVDMTGVGHSESAALPMLMPVSRNGILLVDLINNRSKRLKLRFGDCEKRPAKHGGGFLLRSSSEPHDYVSSYEFNSDFLLTRFRNLSQTHKYEIDITYEYVDFEGRLVPRSITAISKIKGRNAVSTIEFVDYKRCDGRPNDFSLSQFGLPEPVTETPPPPNRNFLWITLASVAAVIVAVLVRRKVKSLEAKAS